MGSAEEECDQGPVSADVETRLPVNDYNRTAHAMLRWSLGAGWGWIPEAEICVRGGAHSILKSPGCHWGWSGGPGLCPPCSQLRALEHLLRFHLVCREIGIIIVPTHKPAGALQTARQVMCCTQRRAHSKHSVNVCGRHRY